MQTWRRCVHVPIFHNLTQLELFSNLKGKSWPEKWKWMVEMLQHTPKLQHLIIHEVISHILWLISWYLFILFNSISTYLNSCFVFWVEIYVLFTGDRKWDKEWNWWWWWGLLGGPKDCSRMPFISAQNLLV